MTRREGAIIAILFAAGSILAAEGANAEPPNTLTPDEQKAGWTLLFDGKTMNGWDDPRLKSPAGDAWTIDNGCLKSNSHPRITEDLFTKEQFRDFELVFDWRISPRGKDRKSTRLNSSH